MSSASSAKTSKLRLFSRSYHEALSSYLKAGSTVTLETARKLGTRAVALDLGILEVAKLHEEALISLALALPRDDGPLSEGAIRRSGDFFAEVITPIEETHRGAIEANLSLQRANDALIRRTSELAASNEELKREMRKRLAVEDALRHSEQTSSQLLQKSRHLQEELRLLSRRLLSWQEEERARISRDLHDVVGQTLTSINLRLAALKSESNANAKGFAKKLSSAQRLMEESVEVVHRFARDLRPTMLDDLGLIPTVKSYLEGVTARTGIRFSLSASAEIENLAGNERTVLFRVAQEAVMNIVRHANASHVTVGIHESEGIVRMEIRDNGKGFEVEQVLSSEIEKRLGLLGMRERVELVGGAFSLESTPGEGATVHVEIPARKLDREGGKEPSIDTNLECP